MKSNLSIQLKRTLNQTQTLILRYSDGLIANFIYSLFRSELFIASIAAEYKLYYYKLSNIAS